MPLPPPHLQFDVLRIGVDAVINHTVLAMCFIKFWTWWKRWIAVWLKIRIFTVITLQFVVNWL